jgi:GTP:adenosylcobinamide-phosphate guanylyltransferase
LLKECSNQAVIERITALESHLREVNSAIEQLIIAIERGKWSNSLQNRLDSREAEAKDLIIEIDGLQRTLVVSRDIPKITDHHIDQFIENMREALTNEEHVEVAREAIKKFVAKVVVNGKAGTIYYTFPLSDMTRNGKMPPRGFEPLFQP